jgi:cell division transport system permease protein
MSSKEKRNSRIVPREDGAAPLDIVIGVMAFLAALALGASLIADRAAESWRAGLVDRLTVQILPPEHGLAQATLDKEIDAALVVLRSTDGIVSATPVSQDETLKLVEPWLGKDALVADLPLPRLIDASILPGAKVDVAALTQRLKQAAPHSALDDHAHWIGRLKALADGVAWFSYGILALIAIATAATVSFATRAGLEAHHDIVGLLHQMGAQSGFVARSFERHYFVSALGAAAIGALLAGGLFLAAGGLEFAGVEPVPFLPPLSLKPLEVLWFLAVPFAAGIIALATARLSVIAALRKIY